MYTLTALCSVCRVVSTEQSELLHTGLRLRDRNVNLIMRFIWQPWL